MFPVIPLLPTCMSSAEQVSLPNLCNEEGWGTMVGRRAGKDSKGGG